MEEVADLDNGQMLSFYIIDIPELPLSIAALERLARKILRAHIRDNPIECNLNSRSFPRWLNGARLIQGQTDSKPKVAEPLSQ